MESAREGTNEVGMAVIASTLTTVCVFVPIVFVEGIAGQLFGDQALTVTFSLFVSLAVAVTLIPMLASRHVDLSESAEERTAAASAVSALGRAAQLRRRAAAAVFRTIVIPVRALRVVGRAVSSFFQSSRNFS